MSKNEFKFEETKKDKKKHKENNSGMMTLHDIMEQKELLNRELNKVKIPCSHTNSEGKLKVDFLSNTRVRCKKCGEEFDFAIVPKKELEKSIETVINVVNQIKAMSDNPNKERPVIVQLGNLAFNLGELSTLYDRTVSKYGKNDNRKKKKNKHNNEFGSYGINSIDFIPNKRNKY